MITKSGLKTCLIYALWLSAGILFYINSGKAESFASFRSLLLLVIGPLILLTLIDGVAVLYYCVRRNFTKAKEVSLDLMIKVLALLFVYLGVDLDRHRLAITQQIGDQLMIALENYRSLQGIYPASLQVEPFVPFQPALKGSEFFILRNRGSVIWIAFHGPNFSICTRTNQSQTWTCGD